MKSQILIDALEGIKLQTEMIPVLDKPRSARDWLVNNQRHWVIRKLDALIVAIRQEGEEQP